jgi:hypothetical protein
VANRFIQHCASAPVDAATCRAKSTTRTSGTLLNNNIPYLWCIFKIKYCSEHLYALLSLTHTCFNPAHISTQLPGEHSAFRAGFRSFLQNSENRKTNRDQIHIGLHSVLHSISPNLLARKKYNYNKFIIMNIHIITIALYI